MDRVAGRYYLLLYEYVKHYFCETQVHSFLCPRNTLFMIDLLKYQAVQWVDGGRKFPDLDCYGVVLEVRKDLGLPDWPDYRGVTKEGNAFDKEAREFVKSRTATPPVPGAMALVFKGRIVNHAAVCFSFCGQLYVMECNPKTNMTISPVTDFVRKNKSLEWWI